MTFVILQSCCNDASCADVCPVDCIHPTPDEPEFMHTEMLHIDPDSCIDCGACVDECPVDAIRADHEIDPAQDRFLELNADWFHGRSAVRADFGTTASAWKNADFTGRRIALVGSGPAAFYAAIELAAIRGIEIEMYDRLPTPYGLIRAGVAPDHPKTKAMADLFRAVAGKNCVRVHLGVDVGVDVSHDDLMDHHDAVVYATGASTDRHLDIPGEDLPGSHAAGDFVAWYNGHPDAAAHSFDLSSERAVVIGNGNVALDVARILTTPPDVLKLTDIADHALEALRHSVIREVVILGRRVLSQAKFTTPELIGLCSSPYADVVVDPSDIDSEFASDPVDSSIRQKLDVIREFATADDASKNPERRRIVLRFLASPVEIQGDPSVSAVVVEHNELAHDEDRIVAVPTGRFSVIDTGLVLRSVGYFGKPVTGVPFDTARGVIPNADGRVTNNSGKPIPGIYVTGWIKRGPTGVIGTNKKCASETVAKLLEDLAQGDLRRVHRDRAALDSLLLQQAPRALTFSEWTVIDKAETDAGAPEGPPRRKLVDADEMHAAISRIIDDRY